MTYTSFGDRESQSPRNVICPQAVEDAPAKFNCSALPSNGRHANIPVRHRH
jgi:hypothetical protein